MRNKSTDENRYFDIDGAEEQFAEFKNGVPHGGNVEEPDLGTLRELGQFVLVSGEEGSGKTSLIHRCAWWLEKPSRTAVPVRLADISRNFDNGSKDKDVYVKRVLRRICDALKPHIEDDQLNRLKDERDDPPGALQVLHSVLEEMNPDDPEWPAVLLVVALPQNLTTREFELFLQHAGPGAVYFVETNKDNEPDWRKAIEDHTGRAWPRQLGLGQLRSNDARRFVEQIDAGGQTLWPPPSDVVDHLEAAIGPPGGIGMTIKGMRRWLSGVLKTAQRRSERDGTEASVTLEDVRAYESNPGG